MYNLPYSPHLFTGELHLIITSYLFVYIPLITYYQAIVKLAFNDIPLLQQRRQFTPNYQPHILPLTQPPVTYKHLSNLPYQVFKPVIEFSLITLHWLGHLNICSTHLALSNVIALPLHYLSIFYGDSLSKLCLPWAFSCPLEVKYHLMKGIRAHLGSTSSKDTESEQHGSDTDQQLQHQKDH